MTAMRDQRRSEKRVSEARPVVKFPVPVAPPKRRPVLLVVSALGVLLWTVFLAWMAWQS